MSPQPPGCLGFILRCLGLKAPTSPTTDAPADVYRLRDDFLSPAEASFFRVLRFALDDRYLVLAKVGLTDLFYVTRPNENGAARSRIAQKHVDFVLCDSKTLRPLAGIELDDASHRKPENQSRDQFKDAVFASAGLRLIRIPAKAAYEAAQVRELLSGIVCGAEPVVVPCDELKTEELSAAAVPSCPKCDVPMVQRTAQKGENRGMQFWGCPNYPRCRQTHSA